MDPNEYSKLGSFVRLGPTVGTLVAPLIAFCIGTPSTGSFFAKGEMGGFGVCASAEPLGNNSPINNRVMKPPIKLNIEIRFRMYILRFPFYVKSILI